MIDYRPNAPGNAPPFNVLGYGSVWNSPYVYEGRFETVEPYAFELDRGFRLLIGHRWGLELPTSERRVIQDEDGLFIEFRTRRCALADDMLLAMRHGFLRGMSWQGRITDSSPERHLGERCWRLHRIVLKELSLTNDPACPFAFVTIPGESLPRTPVIPTSSLERSRLRRLLDTANQPLPKQLI